MTSPPATSSTSCSSREQSDLAAILLAGGRGSRMGGVHKPLLEVGGTTLLDAAIAAARDGGLRTDRRGRRPSRRCAHDGSTWVREDPPFGGPAAAILAALPLVSGIRALSCSRAICRASPTAASRRCSPRRSTRPTACASKTRRAGDSGSPGSTAPTRCARRLRRIPDAGAGRLGARLLGGLDDHCGRGIR